MAILISILNVSSNCSGIHDITNKCWHVDITVISTESESIYDRSLIERVISMLFYAVTVKIIFTKVSFK